MQSGHFRWEVAKIGRRPSHVGKGLRIPRHGFTTRLNVDRSVPTVNDFNQLGRALPARRPRRPPRRLARRKCRCFPGAGQLFPPCPATVSLRRQSAQPDILQGQTSGRNLGGSPLPAQWVDPEPVSTPGSGSRAETFYAGGREFDPGRPRAPLDLARGRASWMSSTGFPAAAPLAAASGSPPASG